MKVNGKIVLLNQNQTLSEFLDAQKFDIKTIAIERNGEIVPKTLYPNVVLHDEDRLEIVRFVGGG